MLDATIFSPYTNLATFFYLSWSYNTRGKSIRCNAANIVFNKIHKRLHTNIAVYYYISSNDKNSRDH